MTDPIVIIGSGLSGYVFATEFRRLDATTPLVMITGSGGEFYSKPMLSTALTANKTAETLPTATASEMEEKLSFNVHAHKRVTAIHPNDRTVEFDGQSLRYAQLVLACGSSVVSPPVENFDLFFTVNDLEDYARYRSAIEGKKHILIMGGGMIGCEFANDLINVGHAVTVVELTGFPVSRLYPEPVARVLQHALEEKGVQWIFGSKLERAEKTERGFSVTLHDGRVLHADLLVSAVGVRSNTTLASDAGLAVNRGVVVDQHLQTSDPHVFALGDCAEVCGQVRHFVTPLRLCAKALSKTLTGDPTPVHYPALPIMLKTPACPMAIAPPPSEDGEWEVSSEDHNAKALFYDADHTLRGFALSGECTKQKVALIKALPDLL